MRKLTKQSQITFVELPPTQYGILNGDASLDVYTRSKLPSRAIAVLQSILINDDFTNTHHINPYYNGDRGKVTSKNFKKIFTSDVLAISSITRTAIQSMELAKNYKQANPKGIVIAGGPDPTFRIEDWLNVVDIVVVGEGEKTISELMNRLVQDTESLEDIDGIAFKKKEGTNITQPRKLLTNEELGQVPQPFYDPIMRQRVGISALETSRGCPHNCNFCVVHKLYGGRYRTRSIDYVIEGLKQIKNMGNSLFFTDDNFIGSPRRAIELLERIAEEGLNDRFYIAQTTVDVARNPKLMGAMKRAGVRALCIGIESINDETLRAFGKPYKAKQNQEAIKTLRDYGFWIHGMMMLGGDGDTPKSLKQDFQWINENTDSVQFSSPVPLPGSDLYNEMEKQGRILTKDWSLYDGQNVLIRPKHFTPYELQKTIQKSYLDFYSIGNSLKRLRSSPQKKLALEILLYVQLGGIMKIIKSPQYQDHLEFLKSVS